MVTELEVTPVLHLDPVSFGLLVTLQRPLWCFCTHNRKPLFYAISEELRSASTFVQRAVPRTARRDTDFKPFSSALYSSLTQGDRDSRIIKLVVL